MPIRAQPQKYMQKQRKETGCKSISKERPTEVQWVLNSLCGPGGSRTLVQTRKPYAFYMLISAFGFRA